MSLRNKARSWLGITESRQRVAIIGDGDNFMGTTLKIRSGTGVKINIPPLMNLLAGPDRVVEQVMLVSISPEGQFEPPTLHGWVYALRQQGIRIETIPKRKIYNPEISDFVIRGYPDSELEELAFRLRDQYDRLVLISGDGRFASMLKILRTEFGKRVEVCGANVTMSEGLLSQTQRYWNLAYLIRDHPEIIMHNGTD